MAVEDEYLQADDSAMLLDRAGARPTGASPVKAALPATEALTARGIAFMFVTGYARGMLPPSGARCPLCEKPCDIARLRDAVAGSWRRPFSGT